MATRVIDHTFTLDDQAENRYQLVGFEVPSGARSLGVSIEVIGEDAVVDLGCQGPLGWRGWSGGARTGYVIEAGSATPGYLPGEPEPGEWHVVLGLHKVPTDGVRIRLEVSVPAARPAYIEESAPVQLREVHGSERELPADRGLTWYAGDLHAHTVHSDGAQSIDQLAARGVRSGLDFLAVTDHNTTSHHQHLPGISARQGISLLPGQEVTTHRGHANAFGDIGFIDFRTPGADWLAETGRRGGLCSINHPLTDDCAWQHPLPAPPAAIELWHISWFGDLANTGPWAYLSAVGGAPVLLGGSDFHHPGDSWTLGTPTTWVAAEDPTPDAILAAMTAGRTAISIGVRPDATPDPMSTPLLLRVDDEVVAVDATGTILVDGDGRRRRVPAAQSTVGGWGRGPYHLEDGDRRVLAIAR